MERTVAATRLERTQPAQAPEPPRALPAPDEPPRGFRIHHASRPPFEWQLRFDAAPTGELAWVLPRGLPWAQDEARDARPAGGGEGPPAPTWDRGRYQIVSSADEAVVVMLEGKRVRGRYALERHDGDVWRLRRLDPASLRPMPERVLPMLAHPGTYPKDEESYAFEIKWDGIRTLSHVADGRVTLRSRNLANITEQYPEIAEPPEALEGRQAILDGEIIALDESGRPSFQRLQGRFGVTARSSARLKSQDIPVVYMVFDVLYLDGHDLTSRTYEERRAILEGMQLEHPWRVVPARVGEGRSLLAMTEFEGVVAKRLGSVYEPGARSRAWIKIKAQKRQEFVIGGWTWGRGSRRGRIGALLVGYHDVGPEEAARRGAPQRFHYAGKVGTGFTHAMLDGLERLMLPDRVEDSPFVEDIGEKHAFFVEPRYVAEIEFTEWTRDGRLRHPSFKGLREDKEARDVTREDG